MYNWFEIHKTIAHDREEKARIMREVRQENDDKHRARRPRREED